MLKQAAMSGDFGRLLAEFLGLLGQGRDLAFHVFGMKFGHFLRIFGLQQALGEVERRRDIALGKLHGEVARFLGADARGRRMGFGGVDRLLGGRDEAVEGELGLRHALLGKGPHFRRDLETRITVFRHRNLLYVRRRWTRLSQLSRPTSRRRHP